ncbi:hypothetical protein HZB89_01815 [archaeon]|nr:hypothetical protein [archaeon]
MAELTGIILGDGCLSKYWAKWDACWRFEIAITGHKHDEPHYLEFIQPMFKKYFGMKGPLTLRHTCNAIQFHVKSKIPFEFFKALGLPAGKKQFDLSIPRPILENNSFALACIRGLWDTDGSIYRRYSKKYVNHPIHYNKYATMELKMKSSIVIVVKKILEANGISCNKIIENKGEKVLRINRQEMIQRYVSVIGFRNKHHLNRFMAIIGNS